MTNEIQVFNFGASELRTQIINGELWFANKDACEILGIHTSVARRLDDDEKITLRLTQDGTNLTTNVVFVNEAGLYSLILGCRKPETKAFKRWITHEVIPSIRKTGGYVANEDTFIETYLPFADETTKQLFKSTLETVRKQNVVIQKQQETIAVQEPKVEAYEALIENKGTHSITVAANILGIGRDTLFQFLREQKILLSQPKNIPSQKYKDKGYFAVRYPKDKYGNTHPRTYVTAKGMEYIRELLKHNGMVA
jgi:prophage antirepressor-like protein